MARQQRSSGAGGAGLGDRFTATSRALRRGFAAAFEPLGVTPHQARALRVVVSDGPLRLGNLAVRLRVAARSATEVVDALADAGWVTRTPDPDDRRAVTVVATDAGRRLSTQVETARRNRAEAFFARLSPADRDELARLLDLLTETDPPERAMRPGSTPTKLRS